jgi:hypothetical protein
MTDVPIRRRNGFRKEYGRQALPGLLLHDGAETTWLADGILAAPWWRVI